MIYDKLPRHEIDIFYSTMGDEPETSTTILMEEGQHFMVLPVNSQTYTDNEVRWGLRQKLRGVVNWSLGVSRRV